MLGQVKYGQVRLGQVGLSQVRLGSSKNGVHHSIRNDGKGIFQWHNQKIDFQANTALHFPIHQFIFSPPECHINSRTIRHSNPGLNYYVGLITVQRNSIKDFNFFLHKWAKSQKTPKLYTTKTQQLYVTATFYLNHYICLHFLQLCGTDFCRH